MPNERPFVFRRELFRHARVAAPRVLDLGLRVGRIEALKSAQAGTQASRLKWAREHLRSKDCVRGLGCLNLAVMKAVAFDEAPEARLPSRESITDPKGFSEALRAAPKALKQAADRVTVSLLAAMVSADHGAVETLSRTLQVLEALPKLAGTKAEAPYAPVVLARAAKPARRAEEPAEPTVTARPERKGPREVLAAWDLANEFRRWKDEAIEARAEALKALRFKFEPPRLDARMRKETQERKRAEARRSQWRDFSAARKTARAEIAADRAKLAAASPREMVEMMRTDADFASAMVARHGIDIAIVADAAPFEATLNKGFCGVYRDAAREATEAGRPSRTGCTIAIDNPCIEAFAADRREIAGQDDVRLIGSAQLITVEEEWLGYRTGEISAVSSVLKGEFHESQSKTTRIMEETSEDTRTVTGERETETTQTTEQELSTQVSREIASRFSSDVTAEASGSGGGTIGVVTFEGAASLGSSLGIGVDTTTSEQSDDRFTQEIVSRAVERAKEVTTQLRRQRSMRMFETATLHRIDNTGTASQSFNAIYCYLDQEICIKERVYGLRQFLTAELIRPGQDLLKQELRRHAVDLAELGRLPDFDLNPAQITPENYLSLVGKYRAANVMPPPPPIRMESRTYKTEAANESKAPEKPMIEKVADTLAPFFGEYKRYLIQDQIEIPEGYRVQEVVVTISHGQNGVSIPAHLPFSVLGAAIYAAPTLGAAAIPPYTFYYLPIAIWQILYTASPLMHYNADSSNVTLSIGHQTFDSRYFFFDPEEALREVLDAVGTSSVLNPEVLTDIQARLVELYSAFGDPANDQSLQQVLTDLNAATFAEISTFLTDLHAWLGTLVTFFLPSFLSPPDDGDGDDASMDALPPIPTIDPSLLQKIPEAIMAPFRIFFDAVMDHLNVLLEDVLGDLFSYFETLGKSNETRSIGGTAGFTGTLPISLNCVTLKPGVTVNLTACLVRIEDEALDLWRLETFERLSQAYAQLEAEFAAKAAQGLGGTALRGNPTVLRAEERESLRVRVMDRLHKRYSATPDQPVTLDELQLFEAAIDWENLTFRLHGYGPEAAQVAHEALGLYATADRKRRAFLDAAWSKVMLPLREDERLEQVLLSYLKTGVIDFETELLAEMEGSEEERYDALTALYRDLVLRRDTEVGQIVSERPERIPTDLVVLYEGTPDAPWPVSGATCGVVGDGG